MSATRPKKVKSPTTSHQLKITLVGSKPPIWRRILVPSDIKLPKLHRVIQATFGWCDCHLHLFDTGDTIYDPEPEYPSRHERGVPLQRVAPAPRSTVRYVYDFGDNWEHKIVVEKILPPSLQASVVLCLGGERACPPEDSGGVWSYPALLEALQNPDHKDHADMVAWLENQWFDPEHFDLQRTNRILATLR